MATDAVTSLGSQSLLGIWDMEPGEVSLILDTAERFLEVSRRTIKKVPTLRGRTVINCFFEPSTRTRCSFEIAEKRLSADTLNFSTGGSSVSKGETLVDTIKNLEAMGPDMIVIRHRSPGVPHLLARHTTAAVVNAGDGPHEHPTQALLDALTIRQRKGTLRGLRVAIVGDILHSRVVRSNVFLLKKMGADVVLCGPPMMMPRYVEQLGVKVVSRVEEALGGADVIMMLRIQLERMSAGFFPTVREYYSRYALTEERLKHAKDDVIVMHPGPMNRGVEITPEVADGPYSVILEQVANGVAVRMAVLYLLSGGRAAADEVAGVEEGTVAAAGGQAGDKASERSSPGEKPKAAVMGLGGEE